MRVLVAEEANQLEDGIHATIRRSEPDIELVTVSSEPQLVAQIGHALFDLIIIDEQLIADRLQEVRQAAAQSGRSVPVVLWSGDRPPCLVSGDDSSNALEDFEQIENTRSQALLRLVEEVRARSAAEVRLRESQRQAAMATLSDALLHELKNALVSVMGRAGLIQDSQLDGAGAPSNKVADWSDDIIVGAQRMTLAVDQLRELHTRAPKRLEVLDVVGVVTDALAQFDRARHADVCIQTHFAPDTWSVLASEPGLQQMLLHLVLNAVDAMPSGGTLAVSTENVVQKEAWQCDLRARQSAGEYVMIRVADTGHGLSSSVRRRMFKPYFSTRGPLRGLGMTAVRRLLLDSGGSLIVDSTPECGTVCEVYLPCSRSHTAGITPELQVKPKRYRLLVVESDTSVVDVVRDCLDSQRYQLITAADLRSGLEVLNREGNTLDGLMVGFRCTDGFGAEMVHTARATYPNLPVLVCSGSDRVLAVNDLQRAYANLGFLPKPFTPTQLRTQLEQLLGSR